MTRKTQAASRIPSLHLYLAGLLCAALPFLSHPLEAAEEEALHWLKTAHLEAGFSTTDGLRLSVLRLPGEANILREHPSPYSGLKTWLMSPHDLPGKRDVLSELPANGEQLDPHTLHFTTGTEESAGLRLEWVAVIDPDEAELTLTQRVHNEGTEAVYAGLWTLLAFDTGITIEIPFDERPYTPGGFPRPVHIFPWSNIGDDRISSDTEAFFLRIEKGDHPQSFKAGMVSHSGKFKVHGFGQVLESTVPYEPTAQYPEGGSNITVYASPGNRDVLMGEGEHMGPLVYLDPGKSMELVQALRMHEADKSGD